MGSKPKLTPRLAQIRDAFHERSSSRRATRATVAAGASPPSKPMASERGFGPGKYDEIATLARTSTNARALILAVIDGCRGNGFEVQAVDPGMLASLPAILRRMADEIEAISKRAAEGA